VGLVWGATPRLFEDSDRSIPLSLLEPVLKMKGVHFFSLQMGSSARQLQAVRAPVTDLSQAIVDFADTAALLSHLHLVISVDTSVVHLSGALAKPTWVLLPFAADWRWLTDREDSPWYPTARLFRQPQARDWGLVIERVRDELELFGGGNRS
jgi:ADP-heptose:LPS heptosyltransferase